MEINGKNNIDLLISKYLGENATPGEKNDLVKWVSASQENRKYFEQIKNIWQVSNASYSKINIDQNSALKKVLGRISGEKKSKILWNTWQKVAAILIIPILITNLIWYLFLREPAAERTVYNEIFTPYGTRTEIKLSDGSAVCLNSGSKLTYPDKFTGKERIVTLSGEAYFEVAANPSFPFIVQTLSVTVRATGTKFNVSEYADDNTVKVALVSGKVFIDVNKAKESNKPSFELNPDQLLEVSKETGKTSVINGDLAEYTSWKDGILIFRNKPLSYVVKRISQVFNVDIEIKGEILQDYHYRATFEDESLSEILKLLKLSAPIDYQEESRKILPDGSFTKRKVIIFPRSDKVK